MVSNASTNAQTNHMARPDEEIGSRRPFLRPSPAIIVFPPPACCCGLSGCQQPALKLIALVRVPGPCRCLFNKDT